MVRQFLSLPGIDAVTIGIFVGTAFCSLVFRTIGWNLFGIRTKPVGKKSKSANLADLDLVGSNGTEPYNPLLFSKL